MEAIYHWVGFAVVWLAVAAVLVAVSFGLNEWLIKPHFGNAHLWVRIFLFGHRFVVSRHKARVLTAAYQKTNQLAWWERNMLAYSIKQARREGRCVFVPQQKQPA